jgi:hypothetical protein
LVGMSRKESSKDESLKKASELRPQSSLSTPFAASRAPEELAPLALVPAPGALRSRVAKKPLTVPTLL